jgi:hypothetical protein
MLAKQNVGKMSAKVMKSLQNLQASSGDFVKYLVAIYKMLAQLRARIGENLQDLQNFLSFIKIV